jgi:small subunit ribosomal protein S2
MTGSIVGVFILGILAGWLAEWLFITFVMDKKQINSVIKPSATSTKKSSQTQTQSPPVVEKEEIAVTKEAFIENPQRQVVKSDESNNKTDIKQDDFMQLKGIGPKLSASIKSININRFDELAAFSGEELLEKLEASGAVVVNRPAFVHIPKQAALAAKGDWDALAILKTSI